MNLQDRLQSLAELYYDLNDQHQRLNESAREVKKKLKEVEEQIITELKTNNRTEYVIENIHIQLKQTKRLGRLDNNILGEAGKKAVAETCSDVPEALRVMESFVATVDQLREQKSKVTEQLKIQTRT